MTNKFFPKEHVTENDLYFVCYMIERVARKLHQPNRYVVNALGYDELYRQLSLASVLHSDNPARVENDWIEENHLESGNYDVIVMDVQMPVMDGYQATAAIRSLPGGDKLKILAYSANAFEEDKQKSLQAGMNGHITKPLRITEFLAELRRFGV